MRLVAFERALLIQQAWLSYLACFRVCRLSFARHMNFESISSAFFSSNVSYSFSFAISFFKEAGAGLDFLSLPMLELDKQKLILYWYSCNLGQHKPSFLEHSC